jgi:cyclophilin family peptidyl-prolyl cis-trans isomerase
VLGALKENYGDDLRIVFRHLPLITIHDKAQISAEAAEAAGAQGMFWEMNDVLFEHQPDWNDIPKEEIIDVFVDYAEEIGVEHIDQFREDLENETYAEKVLNEYETALAANLNSTPSFLVNHVDYPAQAFGLSYEGLDTFIRLMDLRNRWYAEPEQVIDPDKDYIATIETEKGNIVIELYADTAPVNVNNFAFLAQEGWYEDVTFHRVLEDFMAQGGDPTGTGIGFPGYRCGDEITPERTFDKAGVVAMANSGPSSNGSQFFITFGPTPQLNPGFTIIGQVIEGQEIAESITFRDPANDPEAPPGDKIINIVVEEK